MRTTFNIAFVCRKSKANKKDLSPVEVSISINGERTYLALPRKENPVEFKQLVDSRKNNELKEYLSEAASKIQSKQTEMMRRDIPVTASNLKEFIQKGCCDSYTIKDLFDEYFVILKKRLDVDLSKAVYHKYEQARDLFCEHTASSTQLRTITSSVILDFYTELNRKYKKSTSSYIMTRVKTFFLFAFNNGKMDINPFHQIKISKPLEDVAFLTEGELQRMQSKQFSIERIARVRDVFLFQCYSGLSYIDVAGLTKDDIQKAGNTYFVNKKRVKTGVEYTAVILPEGIKILEKYNYVLPVLSNQKYNSYLKEVADLCRITKSLHTHIGRHTYASLCLNKGVRLEVLSRMLGHTNVKQTQHYAKLIKTTIFDEVDKAFNIG